MGHSSIFNIFVHQIKLMNETIFCSAGVFAATDAYDYTGYPPKNQS